MIYLVTGGSGSGKSAYAESLLSGFENIRRRYYIATMQVYGIIRFARSAAAPLIKPSKTIGT